VIAGTVLQSEREPLAARTGELGFEDRDGAYQEAA
jgi:hypothetical protein